MNQTTQQLDEARAAFRARLTSPATRRPRVQRDDSRHPLEVLKAYGLFNVWDFMEVCNLSQVHAILAIRQAIADKRIQATPYPGEYMVVNVYPSQPCSALITQAQRSRDAVNYFWMSQCMQRRTFNGADISTAADFALPGNARVVWG
jgi:hypothetical protein